MADNKQIGVITEVGDLGLGFEPISESDQKKIRETDRTNKEGSRKEE